MSSYGVGAVTLLCLGLATNCLPTTPRANVISEEVDFNSSISLSPDPSTSPAHPTSQPASTPVKPGISGVPGCVLMEPTESFNLSISVKTSSCPKAGTNTLLFFYIPEVVVENGSRHFRPGIGPFQIYSNGEALERGTIDYEEVHPSDIAKSRGHARLCWPDASTLIIERRSSLLEFWDVGGSWKPAQINITITNAATKKVTEYPHNFDVSCEIGWIRESGFYQVGPALHQLQYIGSTKDVVFPLKVA